MTRAAYFALLAAAVASAARADVAVAPPPREIKADGSRDPAPTAEPPKKEDPREVVERIIKNSNAVGDKLAMTDTGTDTRQTQDKILKDIDALLNPDDPPPKPDQDQKDKDQKDKQDKQDPKDQKDKQDGKGNKDDKQDKQDSKGGAMGDRPPPKSGQDPMEGKGGMSGMEEQPGGGDQPKERRPRQGEGKAKDEPKEPKDPGKKSGGGGGDKQQKQDPTPVKPKDSKAGGSMPDPTGDKTPPPAGMLVPIEDDVVKDVWGHLPDKLRQQATQYYKQDIMPRYAELLKRYYSSMAEKK